MSLTFSDMKKDAQHDMFIDVMGKYPPPMYEVLQDTPDGEQKAVLDLGAGSGRW
jgi:hypothetical protein